MMNSEWSQSAGQGSEPTMFAAMEVSESLPGVPSRLATRLEFELLLQEPVIDLGALSALVLTDIGATLEVLRMAGRESVVEERPTRVADALAVISLDRCLQAISATPVGHDCRMDSAWEHGRSIAQAMREVATQTEDVLPEHAYLVGLLHELGALPALLGWSLPTAHRGKVSGAKLAESWHLPRFLVVALEAVEMQRASSPWSPLLAAAHQDAGGPGAPPTNSGDLPVRSRLLPFERSDRKSQGMLSSGVPA